MYLKKLTELRGVPGAENEVRDFIFDKIKDKCDEIYRDSIGNLIAVNRGKKQNPKIRTKIKVLQTIVNKLKIMTSVKKKK